VDTTPAIGADGAIFFGSHNELFALEPNGTLRWRFSAGDEGSKIFTSPALSKDGSLYFGTQGNYIFAMDQRKTVLWHAQTDQDNDSTPVVGSDGTIFFASDDGIVRAYAPGGHLKWATDIGSAMRAPLALKDRKIVIGSTYGKHPFVFALDVNTGKEAWRFHVEPKEGDFYGIQSPALIDGDGFIYFGSRDHHVYCLDPNGSLVWKYKTGDQVDAGPILGDNGTLYIGSDDGRIYAFGQE